MLEENKELGQQTKEIAILNDINSFFCLVPVHFLIFSMAALLYHMTDQKQRTLIWCLLLPVKKFQMVELSQTCRLKMTIWDSVLPESSTS